MTAAKSFPVFEQVDAPIKQTNPARLFAIVHPSAHPLYTGGPEGVAKRARVHWRYLPDNAERQAGLFITGKRHCIDPHPTPTPTPGYSIHQQTGACSTTLVVFAFRPVKPRLPSMSLCPPLSPPLPRCLSLALTQPRLSPINPTVQDLLARPPVTARQMMRCPGPLPRRTP